jgi:hypothetical protein
MELGRKTWLGEVVVLGIVVEKARAWAGNVAAIAAISNAITAPIFQAL